MKIAKRCAIVYLTTFLAVLVSQLFQNTTVKACLSKWVLYVFPIVVIAFGLILGWFGLMIIQYSKWIKSFYLAGLNLAMIAVIVLFPGQSFYHACYLAVHPGARHHFEDHGSLTGDDLSRALDKLYASFAHPRRLHYRGYLFTDRPPAGPGFDTTWIVYFMYQLDPDTTTTRFAKVELNKDRIRILSKDRYRGSDSTYDRLAREFNEDRKQRITETIEAFKSIQKTGSKNSLDPRVTQTIRDAYLDTIP
jgi:hypothetical protein